MDRFWYRVSLVVLALSWLSMLATSLPADPELDAYLTLDHADVMTGSGFALAMNQEAVDAEPYTPIRIEMRLDTRWRHVRKFDGPIGHLVGPDQRAPIERDEYGERAFIVRMEDECSQACVRDYEIEIASGVSLPPDAEWYVTARIIFPEGTELGYSGLVAFERDSGNRVITSETVGHFLPDRGVLLTSQDPDATQHLELVVDRWGIPDAEPSAQGEIPLEWQGGALKVTASQEDALAEVHIALEGRKDVLLELSHDARFTVPFEVICETPECRAEARVSFELIRGDWMLLDWSNMVPGLRTVPGDEWFNGWELRRRDPDVDE